MSVAIAILISMSYARSYLYINQLHLLESKLCYTFNKIFFIHKNEDFIL